VCVFFKVAMNPDGAEELYGFSMDPEDEYMNINSTDGTTD
jgi:hypothetical protein